MENPQHPPHQEPGRAEAISFFLKSRLLMLRRAWRERGNGVIAHPRGSALVGAPHATGVRAPLWTQASAAEFPLTAGKVQNLRVACGLLDGVEIPAGDVFSFWKQIGRTTRRKGFTAGRELRSGCLVPAMGGGLCQLSGLLHTAALKAGIEVIERHAHSRTLPGEPLPPERDATLFWNYVDLRFRAATAWRIEARLTESELVISLRTAGTAEPVTSEIPPGESGSPTRAAADGDCLTCGVITCFRHPSANRDHAAATGHSVFLLDGKWPEFDAWCRLHSRPGDRWLTPLDGRRWKKPNYAWSPPTGTPIRHATWETLVRSWRQRKLPGQGAIRQQFLLDAQRRLAGNLARHLDPQARHLIVSQTLLPHLWEAGHLGGRTFDVLLNRWPMADLQTSLDEAAARHPESATLADFRADPDLVRAESQALAAAARLITPHRAIAGKFGSRAILLDWETPPSQPRTKAPETIRWFFPASALGRKGIHELADAISDVGGELLVLGRAREGGRDLLEKISHRPATVADLSNCTALVIPAWVEHEPRLALLALSRGIPVIANRACGLPPHPLLTQIDAGDLPALRNAIRKMITASQHTDPSTCEPLIQSS